MTRYLRQHFDGDERAALYRALDHALRERVMRLPGFDEEARKLGLDGSLHGTRYTPPIPEMDKHGKPTGRIVNADRKPGQRGAITAPTAGMVGFSAGGHAGRGWQFVGLFSEHGTLLAWDLSAYNESEYAAAERIFADYERHVLPHRGLQTLSVCAADGGFSSAAIRRRLQALRIVPNIHEASHGAAERSIANVANRDIDWLAFVHPSKPHYGNWFANGHEEIACACGGGQSERIFNVSKSGRLSIATKGSCPNCGTVTITAGKWRRVQNPDRIARAFAGGADPAIGNPLTFHDKLSEKYGSGRFGWGESIHATLERRFGLLKDKSWMRSKTEVETEFAAAACGISVLLLERAARRGAKGKGAAKVAKRAA